MPRLGDSDGKQNIKRIYVDVVIDFHDRSYLNSYSCRTDTISTRSVVIVAMMVAILQKCQMFFWRLYYEK